MTLCRFRAAAALCGALLLLAACGPSEQAATGPIELTPGASCSLDGMLLMDYPGPKAQIHYNQGPPDFFCDTVEMFSIYLRPEQQKRVRALYVQDMGRADWDNPKDAWIDARTAFYVKGSTKRGAMGPTLASFAREEDASTFLAQNGGKLYRFDEVTPDMVTLDGGVLRDRNM